MSIEPKFPARPGPQIFLFGPTRNILQNLYNGLKILLHFIKERTVNQMVEGTDPQPSAYLKKHN